MNIDIPTCMHCREPHQGLPYVRTEDSRGRPRARWTCPTTGRGGSTPLSTNHQPSTARKEPHVSQGVSMPVSTPGRAMPDLSDPHLFVVLDAMFARLARGTPSEADLLRAQGDMLAAQAAGDKPISDPMAGQRALGTQLAELMPAYLAHAGILPSQWSVLYPPAAAAAAAPLAPGQQRIGPGGVAAAPGAAPSWGPLDDLTQALVDAGVPRPVLQGAGALAGGAAGTYLMGPGVGTGTGAALGASLMSGDMEQPGYSLSLPFADYMRSPPPPSMAPRG